MCPWIGKLMEISRALVQFCLWNSQEWSISSPIFRAIYTSPWDAKLLALLSVGVLFVKKLQNQVSVMERQLLKLIQVFWLPQVGQTSVLQRRVGSGVSRVCVRWFWEHRMMVQKHQWGNQVLESCRSSLFWVLNICLDLSSKKKWI